jgi:hypothetical protein
MPNKIYFPIATILSVWIICITLYKINSPMDWDELDVGSKLANKEYAQKLTPEEEKKVGIRIPDVLDPRKNVRNHLISNASSFLSAKIFGISKFGLRFPGFLFTLALLIILMASSNLIPKEILLFSLAHLSVNALTLWYFHSMRGYSAMMFFTTAVYLLGLKWMRFGTLRKVERYAFYLLFYITPLTHLFSGIFCLILLTCLFVFSYFESIDRAQMRQKFLFLSPCLPILPMMIYLFYFQFLFINRVGFLRAVSSEVSVPLLSLFGVHSPFALGSVAAMLLACGAYAIFRKRFLNIQFAVVFICWFAIISVLKIVKPSFFEPRFVLCFLMPTLLWVGSLSFPRFAFVKWIPLTAVFLLLPLWEQKTYGSSVQEWLVDYDKFLVAVNQTVDKSKSCFLFSGEADQTYFSRSLFFVNAPHCSELYELHFGHSSEGSIPLEKRENYDYVLTLQVGDRTLYKLIAEPDVKRSVANAKNNSTPE